VYADVTVPPPTPPETFWQDIPQATVKAINAAGGINGAKIQMTFCDSKFDPNTTLACVHQAISGHYAAVIVPTSSVGAGGADALLAKSGLPIFYGIPGPTQFDIKNAVCATSTIIGSGNGVGWMAKSLGVKKLSLAEINSPTFVATGQIVQSALSHAGVAAGSTVKAPIGTPDLSADFAQAMNGGAGGLWYANLPPILNPSIKQFLGSYPKKPLILQYVSYNTLQEVGSAANGELYFPAWTQPLASKVAGAAQYEAAIKKYGSNPTADLNDAYLPAYLTVKLFAGIVATINGPVTASSVLAATKTASNVSLGGLIPNYNGADLGQGGAPCIYENAIVPEVDKNGTLVDLDGSSFLNTKTGRTESATG
jgi:ABC-type branched-subunit amino acid transport system substrate-binding protein